ncbi:hypothetical protein JCM6882_007373 [Rhodosporidiobolus microsporus]
MSLPAEQQQHLVSPAVAGGANPPPQPHLLAHHSPPQQGKGSSTDNDTDVRRGEAMGRAYQKQVQGEALRTTGVALLLVGLTTAAPLGVGWGWRLVLVLLIGATAYHALSHRLSALLLDYQSLSFSPASPSTSQASPSPSQRSSHHPAPPPVETPPHPPPPVPDFESASWVNGILAPLWPIIDRQLFVAVVDMVEDAIKGEAPGVVHSVRITSLSPGSHPISLLGLRVVPSSPSMPFSYFHRTHPSSPPVHAGERGADANAGDEILTESTSALDDPSVPGPAPWSADPEEQGHARKEASAGSVSSPSFSSSAEEGGVGGERVEGPETREEAEGEGLEGEGGEEEGGGGGGRGEKHAAAPGPFVELEVEFGYRRAVKWREPGRKAADEGEGDEEGDEDEGKLQPEQATENVNFVAYLGVGVPSLLTVPFPVLISLTHLRGAVHLRLQLVPEPPFVKTVGFGFREMPEVGIAVHPLHSPLPLDVMTLPLLRTYVLSAIRSVVSSFVLPKHYAVDVRKLMLGGDVAMKTRTVGLLVLVLHRASSLPASDPSLSFLPHAHSSASGGADADGSIDGNEADGETKDGKTARAKRRKGKSDPFVAVGWRGTGTTLYKSKIVPATLDPVWEEMCFVRVPQEPVEEGAKIRLTVMDHDRFNPNDTLGYADLSILDFANAPGEWAREKRLKLVRARKDDAEEGGQETERGEVVVSAAYFPLTEKLSSPSAPSAEEQTAKDNLDTFLSADFADREKDAEEEHQRKKRERLARLDELLNAHHPAPPSHPSGILSFQIHQIASLDLPSKRAPGPVRTALRSTLKPGQSSSMRKADLPSSYVEAMVCDEMVFRTRLKPFSNAPYYNTGSEAFLRDWQQATVSFAVMDYRDRDHDVLAGYVHLDLKEVLKESCQVTKWYPIVGGAGSGRLRASVLFKPLAMHVPRGLREWSVGTLEVVAAKVEGVAEGLTGGRLSFKIDSGGRGSTPSARSSKNGSFHFDLSSSPLYLPVLSRLSPVQVTLNEGKHLAKLPVPGKDRETLHGLFWMNDVVRGKEGTEIKVELSRKRPFVVPNPHNLPSLVTEPPSSDPPAPSPPSSRPPSPTNLHAASSHTAATSSDPLPLPQEDSPSGSSPSPSTSSPLAPTTSSSTPPTLTLHLRWRPGLSSHHASLVLSASSAARASYQLYLHRVDHEAALRREQREEREREWDGEGGGAGARAEKEEEEWEEEEEERREELHGPRKELEVKPRTDGGGKRRRKGGTLRWAWHTAKVATHRLGKARHHHIDDPKPETELQSAL